MSASSVALRPSAIPAVPGPTRLRLPDLLHITDQDADHVLSGRYDHLLPSGGVPEDERWFTRLRSEDELDVWLISWVPGEATELHDHSGSLGALTLLSGALHESRWTGDELRRRRLTAGDQAAFPLGWVHDVTWAPLRGEHADAERARIFPAVDGDVLLRGHRAPHLAPGAHQADPQPGGPMSRIDDVLATARSRLRRLEAADVPSAVRRGAVLVDIRPQAQRQREGDVPTALVVERNVLEWRCDPTSDARLPEAVDDDVEWVVLCSEGYTSSLAAAALQDLGLHRATDVVGGYRALHQTGALAVLTRAP